MREIKFRAPHPDTGRYYYFTFYARAGSDLPGVPAWGTDWMESVEQFTGLRDKNGREIYEGDFIYFTGDNFMRGYSTVLWSEMEAMFVDVSGCPLCDRADVVVCGNIHENPDLMK